MQSSPIDQQRLSFGWESLFAFHSALLNQYASPTRKVVVTFAGDSTTAGDSVVPSYKIDQLFAIEVARRGLVPNTPSGLSVINAGHSGMNTEQWASIYAAADANMAPDLYVLRVGVNDGSRGVPAFLADLRRGLTTFRSIRNQYQTSIALCSPNSTWDEVHLRDARFYEAALPEIREIAREFNCCFIDVYSAFRDSRSAGDYWMDTPFSPPYEKNTVHPLNIFNLWITGLLGDVLVPSVLSLGRPSAQTPPDVTVPNPSTDPYAVNNSLLINFTGEDNSTTATDLSSQAHTVSLSSGAKIAQATLVTPVIGSRATILDHTSLRLGGSDFSIEAQVNIKVTPLTSGEMIAAKWTGNGVGDEWVFYLTPTQLCFAFRDTPGSWRVVSGTFNATVGRECVVAVKRYGNTFSVWDGATLIGSATLPYSIQSTTSPLNLGYLAGVPDYGYQQGTKCIRITKGVARVFTGTILT